MNQKLKLLCFRGIHNSLPSFWAKLGYSQIKIDHFADSLLKLQIRIGVHLSVELTQLLTLLCAQHTVWWMRRENRKWHVFAFAVQAISAVLLSILFVSEGFLENIFYFLTFPVNPNYSFPIWILKVSWFYNVLMKWSFLPKYLRNYFQDICPSL